GSLGLTAVVLRLRGHRAPADHWEPCPLNNGPSLAAASPSSAASISSLERLNIRSRDAARPAMPALVEAGRSSHCTTTRGSAGGLSQRRWALWGEPPAGRSFRLGRGEWSRGWPLTGRFAGVSMCG